MDFKLPFSANGWFSIHLPRVTTVDCSTAVLILLGAAATSEPPNTAKIKFMVCQKLLMIQPPVAFLVPTVLLLTLYFFLDFNIFPLCYFLLVVRRSTVMWLRLLSSAFKNFRLPVYFLDCCICYSQIFFFVVWLFWEGGLELSLSAHMLLLSFY